MKQILSVFLIAFALVNMTSGSVMADDFGDRFYNQAPAGLGDFTAETHEIPDIAMDDVAKDLQEIMPAAGEDVEAKASDNHTAQ